MCHLTKIFVILGTIVSGVYINELNRVKLQIVMGIGSSEDIFQLLHSFITKTREFSHHK